MPKITTIRPTNASLKQRAKSTVHASRKIAPKGGHKKDTIDVAMEKRFMTLIPRLEALITDSCPRWKFFLRKFTMGLSQRVAHLKREVKKAEQNYNTKHNAKFNIQCACSAMATQLGGMIDFLLDFIQEFQHEIKPQPLRELFVVQCLVSIFVHGKWDSKQGGKAVFVKAMWDTKGVSRKFNFPVLVKRFPFLLELLKAETNMINLATEKFEFEQERLLELVAYRCQRRVLWSRYDKNTSSSTSATTANSSSSSEEELTLPLPNHDSSRSPEAIILEEEENSSTESPTPPSISFSPPLMMKRDDETSMDMDMDVDDKNHHYDRTKVVVPVMPSYNNNDVKTNSSFMMSNRGDCIASSRRTMTTPSTHCRRLTQPVPPSLPPLPSNFNTRPRPAAAPVTYCQSSVPVRANMNSAPPVVPNNPFYFSHPTTTTTTTTATTAGYHNHHHPQFTNGNRGSNAVVPNVTRSVRREQLKLEMPQLGGGNNNYRGNSHNQNMPLLRPHEITREEYPLVMAPHGYGAPCRTNDYRVAESHGRRSFASTPWAETRDVSCMMPSSGYCEWQSSQNLTENRNVHEHDRRAFLSSSSEPSFWDGGMPEIGVFAPELMDADSKMDPLVRCG